MRENDGGPAFPTTQKHYGSDLEGMSLRDYFAGQALAGLFAANAPVAVDGKSVHYEVAAYAVADAMLKERGKA